MINKLSLGLGLIRLTYFLLLQSKYECSCSLSPTDHVERPGKSLCKNETTDCSNQIHGEPPKSCLMKFFSRNSKECTDAEFEEQTANTENYGTVTLTPFAWYSYRFTYPTLNITFSNIKWKSLRMRFLEVADEIPHACREFVVKPGDIIPSDVVSFDCHWYNKLGEAYRFQYVITTEHGHKLHYHYLFHMPKDTHVGSVDPNYYQLFLLMDYSALPTIRLKLQVPPFETSNINISLFFKEKSNSEIKLLETWKKDLLDTQKSNFLTIEHSLKSYSIGYYYFNATFHSHLCSTSKGCPTSSTPHLRITRLEHDRVRHGIFITWWLLFGSLVVYIIWKYKLNITINQVKKSPNVLFLYESSYPSHIENIYKFKGFLKDYCCVTPKLDLIDIPKTEAMNPWTWYYQAFEEADFVLVFASPRPDTEKGLHEDNVYHNLYAYALRLLLVHLTNKHKFLAACIKLPGCAWDTLPCESVTVTDQFSLPERLDELLKFLRVPTLKNGRSTLLTVLNQPRIAPQLYVSRPEAPLLLPFDAGNFDLIDDDVLEPPSIGGFVLNLGGLPSSENDDDEDVEETSSYIFNDLKM